MELAVKRKHERANIPAFNPFGSNKDEVDVPSFKYWNRLQVFRILTQICTQIVVDHLYFVIVYQEYFCAAVQLQILPDDDALQDCLHLVA